MVSAEAAIFTRETRPLIPVGSRWIASTAASVPSPAASLASSEITTPQTSPPNAVTAGIRQDLVVPTASAWPSPIGVGGR